MGYCGWQLGLIEFFLFWAVLAYLCVKSQRVVLSLISSGFNLNLCRCRDNIVHSFTWKALQELFMVQEICSFERHNFL